MLTLVVPIYNKEQYIHRCMKAMLAQTSADYEILLVDDGSTDHSGALCDRYAAEFPEHVRCIHKPNGGLSSARNAGIEAANGRWITFPDPDDWVEPEYVQTFLELQAEHQTELVCTGHWVEEGERRYPGSPEGDAVIMTAAQGRRALLLPPRMGGFAWNKIYSLELLRRHGLRFRDDVGAVEDLDFAYRYLQLCQGVCFCPGKRTCHYDQNPDSITHGSFSRRKLDAFRVYEMIAEDPDPVLARAAREDLCVGSVNYLWELLRCGKPDLPVKRLLLKYIRRNLWAHLTGRRYNRGRKLQALTAAVSPRLFVYLKAKARSGAL